MAYTLAYSGGTITVNDGSLNTQTSLAFPGRNYAGYGTYVDQNMLSMLENFASSTSGPSNAIKGQIWFDANTNRLKYNISSTLGSPSWRESVTSGIGQDIAVRNITMADNAGVVNGVLTTRNITAGSSTATGTIVGQWTLPVGSSLTGNIVLPTASPTQLGGIKVGSGLSIDGNGVLSAAGGGSGVTQIVAGANVSISSTGPGGTGVVTINSSGGGGSGVTSVAVTSGDMAVTGSPITGAGTVNLSLNTVPITKGGTGQTSASGALNALLPTQSGNSGALLTTNGTNASWAQFPSSVGESGYTTLPGGIILYWGSVYTTEDIPNPQVLLKTVTFPPGLFSAILSVSGTIYSPDPINVNDTWFGVRDLSTSGMTIAISERGAGFNPGPRTAFFQVIGTPALPGSPTSLNFNSSWTNQGPTSTVTLTGTATGATLQYDWSIDGGATYPITNTNPASFSGISNSVTSSITVRMRVRNSVVPSGITFTQIITNPNYPLYVPPESGGDGGG